MNRAQSKTSAGTVAVITREGRLRLQFPRSLFGKQKYLALGLTDTKENRLIAQKKAAEAELDIKMGMFDFTFNKYKPGSHLTVVEPFKAKQAISLTQLWSEYVDYKSATASPKTINSTYNPVTAHLSKCATDALEDAIKFRMELLTVTTESQARRTLMQLSAACKWGIQNRKINHNPLGGLYKDLRPSKGTPAVAFSPEERDRIIEAFRVDPYYRHYASYVEFLFLTGCRPCEAIGLRWGSITEDCDQIHFHESIVEVSGKLERRKETKTGVKRWFPCTKRLQALLKSIKPEDYTRETLVFSSPKGGAIGESNFVDRGWNKVLGRLGLLMKNDIKMTPYNCRDTFITLQLCQNVSSTTVAKWVGNSSEVIEKNYLDKIKLAQLRPAEI